MKKTLSVLISIIMIICAFITALPSYALSAGNFTYELNGENAVITGYKGTSKSFTVPATVGGKEVKAVSEGAFKGNTNITSVKISEGVESIGAGAFEDCTNLATITLPSTILHVGEKAIYNTAYYNNKSNWRLKKDPGEIGNGDSIDWEDIGAPVLQYLYLGDVLIELELEGSYSIKYGALVIADGACKENVDAKYIGIPSTVVSIGNKAFYGCESLTSLGDIKSVDYIGDSAFENCTVLENIDISETTSFNANAIKNTGFYNNPENWENGTLYMDERVVGTDSKINETYIKEGATHIIDGALGDKSAVIPASVINIAENAFTNTENVKIFGYTNTFAQTYAKESDIPFINLDTIKKGDMNCDGNVDKSDYSILSGISNTKNYQSYTVTLIGDMDEDGAVDGFDVIILDLMLNDMPPSNLEGDVNGDNKVDTEDYKLLVKIVSTHEKITDNLMFKRADINEDGAVDSFDVINLDLALNSFVLI